MAIAIEEGPALDRDVEAADRARLIRRLSEAHGFDRCAVAAIEELPATVRLREWLHRGMQGSMEWMARSADQRCDPKLVVPDAKSVVIVAVNYHTDAPATDAADEACLSRYAWGTEYHRVLGDGLESLYAELCGLFPGLNGRWYVDTGPVLEKAWAERAGLGWIGKHTNLIHRDLGSWIFLGALILNIELETGTAHGDYCGTCTACIDACPTDAIVAPYVLDARRCISYLTIENRGPIPREFRRAIGNRVYGCDDCQDVCPWNRFAHEGARAIEFAPRPGNDDAKLIDLLALTEEEFRARFKDSPVLRAKRRGFVRNVAVALGNSGDPRAVTPLVERLDDDDELVRGHVAWALGELGGDRAHEALCGRLEAEEISWVRAEIGAALDALGGAGDSSLPRPAAEGR